MTGDDFGASVPVNEAIEQAHRNGILNTASLMIGAAAADDAVARARRLPTLKVGLHLVLVNGRPVLPAREVPGLVDVDGRFSSRLVRAGIGYFFRPSLRRQMAAEIRAQFERYRDTGLALDHVNAHNHMHLHPTILGLILEIGPAFGLRAVRLPHEPFLASWRAIREAPARRLANDLLLRPLVAAIRWRLNRAGLKSNDYVFGMNDTGRMARERVLRILAHLPRGVSEIYFHPATRNGSGGDSARPSTHDADELAALTDAGVAAAIAGLDIEITTFSDLAASRPGLAAAPARP